MVNTGLRFTMADSPLSLDKKLLEQLNIDDSVEMSDDFKLAFVKAQLDEIKKMIWRTRVDSLVSHEQMKSEDENIVADSTRLAMQYKNQLKQMATSVRVYQDIIKELEV